MLFGIIAPNVALVLYPAVPYLAQAWSIGTEEQFYVFWPWIVRWAGQRVLLVLVGVALFFIVLKFVLGTWYYADSGQAPSPVILYSYTFLYYFRIECMAIGGVLATLLFLRHDAVLRVLMARPTQWLVLVLIAGLLIRGHHLPLHEELSSVLFGVLILNLAAAKQPVIWLEHPWLNYLGKITYGLYMLHSIAIVVVLRTTLPYYFSCFIMS